MKIGGVCTTPYLTQEHRQYIAQHQPVTLLLLQVTCETNAMSCVISVSVFNTVAVMVLLLAVATIIPIVMFLIIYTRRIK